MAPIGRRAAGWQLGPEVTGITMDSRQVQPGFIFVAVPGFSQDGHKFIQDAMERGAVAVVGEQASPSTSLPYFRVSSSRQAAAELAAEFYGNPSESLTTIGVTGTNGKTTVVFWLSHLLRSAGLSTGMISSVVNETGSRNLPANLTTPESPDLQGYLAEMLNNRRTHAVVEVSSHGIAQHRIDRVAFKMAILTNITREHLDFHGTMERYVETKARLFQGLGPTALGAVINADDPHFELLAKRALVPVIGFGLSPG
ncbi:MAG: Mur ligase family protein, partial [Thermaerobacter sp.]|nr:Mur ligase family protein [Thermaerobacter sp.]